MPKRTRSLGRKRRRNMFFIQWHPHVFRKDGRIIRGRKFTIKIIINSLHNYVFNATSIMFTWWGRIFVNLHTIIEVVISWNRAGTWGYQKNFIPILFVFPVQSSSFFFKRADVMKPKDSFWLFCDQLLWDRSTYCKKEALVLSLENNGGSRSYCQQLNLDTRFKNSTIISVPFTGSSRS